MKKAIAETERHRLPSFDCPNPDCRAKHIVFATNRDAKNETVLIPIDKFTAPTEADFVIACPNASNSMFCIGIENSLSSQSTISGITPG